LNTQLAIPVAFTSTNSVCCAGDLWEHVLSATLMLIEHNISSVVCGDLPLPVLIQQDGEFVVVYEDGIAAFPL